MDYFDPAQAGFRQLLELYEFVDRHIHRNPVVVDADDLLDYPNEILKSYCEAVGLEYEENMTSWEPGPVPEWDAWAGWHEDALKSSGFKARVKKNRPRACAAFDVEDLPPEVGAVVEECMPYYEALFRQLLELYEFVDRHIHRNPIVVDADDLLDYPNEILKSYCEAVGLEYEENMTSWEPGPVPEWDACTCVGWQEDVLKSSGFKARVKKASRPLPPEVAAVAEECMPYYEALSEKKILPKKH
ncbi:hypothetical protein OS493_010344 [Desmophyllum pertusum]|uniref:Sulfotransferase family protein n=1 Tax=Desmophyllum pertusum TaxID=174260 RepID=A0A9X0A444_9CNID|nr:hypothetical protein OS493_010344 [Desmophyllum pertusum]